MIPKTIHYCWFGKNPKSELILRCLESWKTTCPDFTITEWNEENFPIDTYPFAQRMYKERKWAFVADYARLIVLEEHGGFYLDTDMLLLQTLLPLTTYACVLGEESTGIISAGMMAATAHHPFIKACRDYYNTSMHHLVAIPVALTSVFSLYHDKNSLTVYPPKAFYPFDSEHIKEFKGQALGQDVIGVHLWNYSWGHPLNKFFKKIGLYSYGKKLTETLGIKKLLKRLLGFI